MKNLAESMQHKVKNNLLADYAKFKKEAPKNLPAPWGMSKSDFSFKQNWISLVHASVNFPFAWPFVFVQLINCVIDVHTSLLIVVSCTQRQIRFLLRMHIFLPRFMYLFCLFHESRWIIFKGIYRTKNRESYYW